MPSGRVGDGPLLTGTVFLDKFGEQIQFLARRRNVNDVTQQPPAFRCTNIAACNQAPFAVGALNQIIMLSGNIAARTNHGKGVAKPDRGKPCCAIGLDRVMPNAVIIGDSKRAQELRALLCRGCGCRCRHAVVACGDGGRFAFAHIDLPYWGKQVRNRKPYSSRDLSSRSQN